MPIHHLHPATTTTPDVEARVLAPSLEHPSWERDNRLSDRLTLEGVRTSGPTVQRIPDDHGMGTHYDRWLALEEQQQQPLELTAE